MKWLTLRIALIFQAILWVAVGLGTTIDPRFLRAGTYGMEFTPDGVWFARFGGVTTLGTGLLAFLLRDTQEVKTRRAVIITFLFIWVVHTVFYMIRASLGLYRSLGWVDIANGILWSIIWLYFAIAKLDSD